MRVMMLQLNANVKPLLNNTYINTSLKQHEKFEMVLNGENIEVVHPTFGAYTIPLTSISWFQPDPVSAGYTLGQKPPVKRGRGRPRKTPVIEKATLQSASN